MSICEICGPIDLLLIICGPSFSGGAYSRAAGDNGTGRGRCVSLVQVRDIPDGWVRISGIAFQSMLPDIDRARCRIIASSWAQWCSVSVLSFFPPVFFFRRFRRLTPIVFNSVFHLFFICVPLRNWALFISNYLWANIILSVSSRVVFPNDGFDDAADGKRALGAHAGVF